MWHSEYLKSKHKKQKLLRQLPQPQCVHSPSVLLSVVEITTNVYTRHKRKMADCSATFSADPFLTLTFLSIISEYSPV